MTGSRRVLVLAEAAPWLPGDGFALGPWTLEVVRIDRLGADPPSQEPAGWDVVVFRVDGFRPELPEQVLATLRELAPDATFLPVAVTPDPREALGYLKRGAFEYLEEPLTPEAFLAALTEAIENRDTFREVLALNRVLEAQREQLLVEKAQLEKRNRELEAMSRLARALATTLDLGETLHQLARCIHDTFGFGRIVIGLVDHVAQCEEARVALAPAGAVSEEDLKRMRWFLRDGNRHPWIRTVLQEGKVLRVDDPAGHPATRDTPLAALHPKAFVKVPLVSRDRVTGTITVEHGAELTEEDLGILRMFADTAAMAVENARLYHSMRELSVRDELTGLFNRRHLLRQVEAEWGQAERHRSALSLVLLDIDHFKRLNDGNDHLTGDAALRRLGGLLLRNTRGIDTVARYGGEEFVVLLPRTPKHVAVLVADKLRRVVGQTAFEGEAAVPGGKLTISAGVACYPEDAASVQELMERADWALYRAKRSGRNRVVEWFAGEEARAG